MPFKLRAIMIVAVGGMGLSQAACADPIEDFFRGKTISYVIQAGPGGAYGINAQILANHMPKYIPGKPTIVLQHMPGAGGVKASNYVYNAAAKDGTIWGMLSDDLAVVQKMRPATVRYDAAKLGWIGRIIPNAAALSVYHTSGVRSLDEVKQKEIILGHTGRGNQYYVQALLLQDLLGLKLKNVAGYRGGPDMYLAMERGEIHGRIGSLASLKSAKPDWLAEKKMNFLLVVGTKRNRELPDVPTVLEVTQDPVARQVFGFFGDTAEIGWTACTPPDMPSERLAALRRAFDQMVKDPEYRAEMKARNLDLDPISGAELELVVKRILAAPDEVVQKVAKYTTQ